MKGRRWWSGRMSSIMIWAMTDSMFFNLIGPTTFAPFPNLQFFSSLYHIKIYCNDKFTKSTSFSSLSYPFGLLLTPNYSSSNICWSTRIYYLYRKKISSFSFGFFLGTYFYPSFSFCKSYQRRYISQNILAIDCLCLSVVFHTLLV